MKIDVYCNNWWSCARGLMFRSKKNLVMEFDSERKVNLHMWFVFYPIDVYVLDSSKKVVEVKKNFKPFTFWSSSVKGKYVVEMAYPKEYKIGEKIKI